MTMCSDLQIQTRLETQLWTCFGAHTRQKQSDDEKNLGDVGAGGSPDCLALESLGVRGWGGCVSELVSEEDKETGAGEPELGGHGRALGEGQRLAGGRALVCRGCSWAPQQGGEGPTRVPSGPSPGGVLVLDGPSRDRRRRPGHWRPVMGN